MINQFKTTPGGFFFRDTPTEGSDELSNVDRVDLVADIYLEYLKNPSYELYDGMAVTLGRILEDSYSSIDKVLSENMSNTELSSSGWKFLSGVVKLMYVSTYTDLPPSSYNVTKGLLLCFRNHATFRSTNATDLSTSELAELSGRIVEQRRGSVEEFAEIRKDVGVDSPSIIGGFLTPLYLDKELLPLVVRFLFIDTLEI